MIIGVDARRILSNTTQVTNLFETRAGKTKRKVSVVEKPPSRKVDRDGNRARSVSDRTDFTVLGTSRSLHYALRASEGLQSLSQATFRNVVIRPAKVQPCAGRVRGAG
jgi:hypothetical protein